MDINNLLAFILSLLALIFTVLSVTLLWYLAIPAVILGAVAVIMGGSGLNRPMRGFAVAAVIIGALSFLIAGVKILSIFL